MNEENYYSKQRYFKENYISLEDVATRIKEDYKIGLCEWTSKNDDAILIQDLPEVHVKSIKDFLQRQQRREGSNNIITNAFLTVFKKEALRRNLC